MTFMWSTFQWCAESVFFFFFKQKTAYEIRISDWSSDVFSSDLSHVREYRLRGAQQTEYIGVEESGRLVGRCFLHRADHIHARIVDQHIDTTGLTDDELNCTMNGSVIANIHLD